MVGMPMALLRSLAECTLPVEISDPDAWAMLLVLERAHLICADIPPPRSLTFGRRGFGTAVVHSVTVAGLRAAGLADRTPAFLPPAQPLVLAGSSAGPVPLLPVQSMLAGDLDP